AGFVDSLARPGGNATGFTLYEYGMGGKWLEVLKEVAPSVTRAAVLRDPTIPQGAGQWGAIQTAAPSFGIEVSFPVLRSTLSHVPCLTGRCLMRAMIPLLTDSSVGDNTFPTRPRLALPGPVGGLLSMDT